MELFKMFMVFVVSGFGMVSGQQVQVIASTIPTFATESFSTTHDTPTEEELESLIDFLQRVVKKHGNKKVASSIYELAQKSMYELTWLLAGDLDAWLVYDLYKVYSYSQTDAVVLSVYDRFRTGNVDRSIVPVVFDLDKKYNQYAWWRRVRGRMLDSVEKYIAGTLVVNTDTEKRFPETPTQLFNTILAAAGGEEEDDEE